MGNIIILMIKVWPLILCILIGVGIFLIYLHIKDKRLIAATKKKKSTCIHCQKKDQENFALIGNRVNNKFFLRIHKSCIINYIKESCIKANISDEDPEIALQLLMNYLKEKDLLPYFVERWKQKRNGIHDL